ncbi:MULTISPECIES: ThiF family adenylyltransferase [Acinetobacter calcoaceticus/baumannii complex]|uniref:ThiF family adenylyltransferase n=1 Tax=Acinetobacter calcoaceticus/baumannii complex TaxID=909768 RepID=UPI0006793583|nr:MULTISPECIES: ThiF family adenylyltransferase [Acinetobacter calcoaceticus/baumannii complex]MBR7740259.1 ThiF family adenylyltransferase [Acinetobacter nosocomialis]PRV98013.1 thiF family protein [Acinetobacter sp. AR_0276]
MIPIIYAKYLIQLGYSLVDPCDTNLKKKFYNNLWVKKVVVGGVDIRLGVFFRNWDFISPPNVYLFSDDLLEIKKINKYFKFPLPHFSIEHDFKYLNKNAYNFCYALHDKVEINRKNFTQILAFLEAQFQRVILDLFSPSGFVSELRKEIVPIWMILSNKFEKKFKMESLFVELERCEGIKNISLTYYSADADGAQKTIKSNFIILRISSINFPLMSNFFNEDGDITLGKMLLFIYKFSQRCFILLKKYLSEFRANKKLFISLCFENHMFSFFVDWKRVYQKSLDVNIEISSEFLRELVFPVYVKNYCMQELINRNIKDIKSQNLSNLKILQIGAGAIGGYVADALIKIGASLEEGNFKICDSDDFKVENLGRHILGRQYVGLNKADAIVKYIKEQFGDKNLNIQSIGQSVNTITNFSEYDLVIDATGQIEIAEYLNEKILQIPKEYRPNLLHLWIYGNGECVQALINLPSKYESKGGCISCLHQSGMDDYKEKFDPLGNKDFLKIMGLGPCAAYTPYSVSASLAVAGLAIDLLLEWRNSTQLVNNYFTRYSVAYSGTKIFDMELTAQESCPHCLTKS